MEKEPGNGTCTLVNLCGDSCWIAVKTPPFYRRGRTKFSPPPGMEQPLRLQGCEHATSTHGQMKRYTVGMCHVSKICRFLTCIMLFHHPSPTFVVFSIVQFTSCVASGLKLGTFLYFGTRSQGVEHLDFMQSVLGFPSDFYPHFRWVNLSNFNSFNLFGNTVDTEVLCWFSFGQHSQQRKNPSDADEPQLRGRGASGLELCHQGGLPKCGAFASNAGASWADGERWTCRFGAWAMLKHLFSTTTY